MSLEVIELMIKESLRDGEISTVEKETILKQADEFGISKETAISMIDEEVKKSNLKKSEEVKRKQEAEKKEKLESEKRKIEAEKRAVENAKKEKDEDFYRNFYKWKENWDWDPGFNFFTWCWLYAGPGALLGILNAYTHDKGWGAYFGMFFLGLLYGFITYGIVVGISFATKRKPLLDWHKTLLIPFGLLVIAFICYFVIPF